MESALPIHYSNDNGDDNGDDVELISPTIYKYLGISDHECESPLLLSILSSLLERATQRNDRTLQNANANGDLSNTNYVVPRKKQSVFHGVSAPPIDIHTYVMRIFRYAKCSPSCLVLAYAYITKLTCCRSDTADIVSHRLRSTPPTTYMITSLNVHRLLITSVMIAAKFIDDRHYNNAYYAKIGGVSKAEMNALELAFLSSLGYRLHMSLHAFHASCINLGKEAAMQAASTYTISSPLPFNSQLGQKPASKPCNNFDEEKKKPTTALLWT